ncbi:MAG: NADP-dependent phosphogluconate dehydrogenase [Christensenellaceae bacterium]|nr:NADP-dependent phosphogluconate dehydrogenase [Christensenellaceae bacterium]
MRHTGVIGMAVMGKNLALNIAEHGFPVSVYNRTYEKARQAADEAGGLPVEAFDTLESFVRSLTPPRVIIMMVKAGEAVDQTIGQLLPLLEKGDVLIDGGNSYFKDTERRCLELAAAGVRFLGAGSSGGEEGARHGPAIMPGGDAAAYDIAGPMLRDISARAEGEPCCTYIGKGGSGHFVKMVHNGIEYADMQLICEAYDILKNVQGMSADEMRDVFADWNRGELNSYLIEITADILGRTDPETGAPLVDVILDAAAQKGTGKWTSREALDLGIPAPTITEAVFERYLSAMTPLRAEASKALSGPAAARALGDGFVESVRRALYASKICAYAQGFGLMVAASGAYGWELDLAGIAKIFRGGCIIRAQFLNRIVSAYGRQPALASLLLDEGFGEAVSAYQQEWRGVVAAAVQAGIPVPGMASALCYYDSLRAARLPMNLMQAQRDYFGAHTYQRVDKPGSFHTQWQR